VGSRQDRTAILDAMNQAVSRLQYTNRSTMARIRPRDSCWPYGL